MDRLLEVTETLPVAPGSSPFHARGIFYDQVLKHAEQAPGGMPAFLAQLKDARLREFMEQKFKWTQWYDALPMTAVQQALCRAEGTDFETSVRRRARNSAEALVPRLFRAVIGMGSVKAAAGQLPNLLSQNYDFSQMRLDVTSNEGRAHFMNVPALIAPGFVNTVAGLVEGGLRLMGAKTVEFGPMKVSVGTPQHGYDSVTVEAITTWTK